MWAHGTQKQSSQCLTKERSYKSLDETRQKNKNNIKQKKQKTFFILCSPRQDKKLNRVYVIFNYRPPHIENSWHVKIKPILNMEIVIPNIPYYLSNGLIAEFKKDLEARDEHRILLSDCLKEMDELKLDIMDHQPCNAPSLPWYAEYSRAEEIFDILSHYNIQLATSSFLSPRNDRRFDKMMENMILIDETYGEDYLYFWSSYMENWEEVLHQFYENLGYWKNKKTQNRKTKKRFFMRFENIFFIDNNYWFSGFIEQVIMSNRCKYLFT